MESVIKSSIFDYLISNDLISSNQFGFLPGHSCTTQLLHVMDIITSSLDHGLPVDVIYLDLQKAFDSVPHNRLLCKVESYGICGKFLNWIKGFLMDRDQCVVLNGCKFRWQKVLSGVPQGSILGPLLVTIYINNLPQSISSSIFMFADDTKLICSIQSIADHILLQADLDCLLKWCERWQLNFNISKCKLIHYGKNHGFGEYYMNGHPLTSVDHHKDLGVTFDCHLNFHQHTSEVASKANRVLACMKRAFTDLNNDGFLKLYKAMVRPIMEYANTIWGPHFLLDIRRLERVQRRATKMIPSLSDKSYQHRLTSLDLPSLTYRNTRGDLTFLYKLLNGYFNLDFSTFFTLSPNIDTRGNSLKLYKPFTHHLCRSNYFSVRVINHWNQLPEEIVSCTSLNRFKISP